MKLYTSILIAGILSLSACSGKKVLKEDNVDVTKNEVLDLRVNWLKNKGDKFDLEMTVINISKEDIIIMLNDVSCAKGSFPGVLRHTFFNTGEKTIDIRASQLKRFTLVCDLRTEVEGPYTVSINRIYTNLNSDGVSKGKTIGDKVVWTGTPN